MDDLDLTRLMELERRGWDALCRSEGGEFYRGLMTADAVMVLVNGMVLDRDAVAGSLSGVPPWTSYEIADPRVVTTGTDAAALVYRASASRDGDAGPFVALMCSVYQVVDGAPRLTLHQQTAVVT